MKKQILSHLHPIAFATAIIAAGILACACSGNKTITTADGALSAPHLSLVDYQTDIPMLAYAFCKIKPEAAPALAKFCVGLALAGDRDQILALIEEKLLEHRTALLTDEYTRKWLISKTKALIGITIDPQRLNITAISDTIDDSKMKQTLLLICEGVRAYQASFK
jgi:hypothetical protein